MQQAAMEKGAVPPPGHLAAAETPVVKLEIPPPRRLALGRGNAFVIGGYAYHPREQVLGLAVEVAGRRTPVAHAGLPRLDAFGSVTGDGDSAQRALHSGFVAMPKLTGADGAGELEVRLVMSLRSGRETSLSAGTINLERQLSRPEGAAPGFPGAAGSRVAICMATYDPPDELLERQLASIRAQSHQNWVCLISDDGSRPERLDRLRELVEGDERFVVSASPSRAGFYTNFERALAMAPDAADFVALCDQDDHWHPDKLERLLERMDDGVQLAYSDARVMDASGRMVHSSYWTARRTNYSNLGSLLIANTVTGAASLFRAELLADLLPFPPRLAEPFHDHWLSLIALALGRIAYVDEPLYDYVQHGGAVIGHDNANRRPAPVRERLRRRLREPGDGSRIVYFYNWSQQQLFAEVLRMRCWERMAPQKRRALRRFISADTRAGGLAWLLGRRLRRLWGRNETMDIERFFGKSLLRMRLVSLWMGRRQKPPRLLPRDASIPDAPAREGAP